MVGVVIIILLLQAGVLSIWIGCLQFKVIKLENQLSLNQYMSESNFEDHRRLCTKFRQFVVGEKEKRDRVACLMREFCELEDGTTSNE